MSEHALDLAPDSNATLQIYSASAGLNTVWALTNSTAPRNYTMSAAGCADGSNCYVINNHPSIVHNVTFGVTTVSLGMAGDPGTRRLHLWVTGGAIVLISHST